MALRAAIYARKSNEQNVSDDAKSVARQIELARAFADKHGWTVNDEHVYVDDAVSGAEFVDRADLTKMVVAAKSAPRPFDVLVTMDQDRIGRDQIRTPMILNELIEAGVRMFYYASGQELRLDSPTDKLLSNVVNFGNEFYRHQVREKTREAMRSKAQKGYVAGGKVLGYRNVEVKAGDRRSHVVREIDPEQAEIVCRIFRMAADGKGLLRIAKTLNAEGVKNPTGQDRGGATKRSDKWSNTGVREVLHRELYRGKVVYGKTPWVDKGGTKVKVDVPESEWSVLEQPELRIVPEALWQAAQDRMAKTHDVYLRRTGGQLGGKPESGLESRYLLSGFLHCGVCGGNLIISKKTGQRGRPQTTYICSTRRTRGDAACVNKHGVPAVALADAVLAQLKHVFLNPASLGSLLMLEWEERRKAPEELACQRQEIAAQVAKLDGELKRLGDAIASGTAPQTILEAIGTREAERRELQAKLEHLDGLAIEAKEEFDLNEWLEETKGLFADVRETLEADPTAGRQVLRRLLVGPVTVTPKVENGILFFEFAGTSSYAEFDLASSTMVPKKQRLTGRLTRSRSAVSDVWCPRGDSNTRHAV